MYRSTLVGKITQINIYPIKSTKGKQLNTTKVTLRGLQNDRRWLLTDAETHKALTQREKPEMAFINATVEENLTLKVSFPGKTDLILPLEDLIEQEVFIWKDTVMAQKYNNPCSQWFSEVLGIPCDLVYMPDKSERQIDTGFSEKGKFVSFADDYPLLITTEQSLANVNEKLASPIDMRRFRPNIVISSVSEKPFEEDNWKQLKIGDLVLDLVKPCARCVLTTVNPDEGKKSKDGEPLRVLSKFRKTQQGIIFGQWAIPKTEGLLSLGDQVILLE